MSVKLDLDFNQLDDILKNGKTTELNAFCSANNLEIKDGFLYYKGNAADKVKFWDKLQLIKKILLNSCFGSLSNPHCRFFDRRIGQSITLSGRSVVKHMISEVNKVFTGKYEHGGDTYLYGDSVTGDSMVFVEDKPPMQISELFDSIPEKLTRLNKKQYAIGDGSVKVLSYDPVEDKPVYNIIHYVMKHVTDKEVFKVTMVDNTYVKVTKDHSIMVERNYELLETKPEELQDGDFIISLQEENINEVKRQEVKLVEKLPKAKRQVYDISILKKEPYFFANGHLMHNTDSCYFSAYDILKNDIDKGNLKWDKETVMSLYDHVCEKVNKTFMPFMKKAFNCPETYAKPMAAGREIIGTSGLFITKKRYAIMVYDNEGTRCDVDGKPGKIKAMGLDLRRSDTPVFIQEFLKEILQKVLLRQDKSEIMDRIVEYRDEFRENTPWKKGSPKSVNKLTWYKEQLNKGKKLPVPGHVRASLNWNTLRKMNDDNFSLEIVDGMKIVVCKLRANPMGMTSIAYPTDEPRLPEWFKELPFDEDKMEDTILDTKLDNLIGSVGFNISETRKQNMFDDLFEF